MKKFAFVSDFDGTLTDKDFYWIIIDKYLKESGKELYRQWKEKKMPDVEFLGAVFESINRTEPEILDDILSIPFDKYAKEFIEKIKKAGGDFIILSAGTSYYIEILLQHEKIDGITIISNKGIYKNRGVFMLPDKASPYYSEIYGVDKALVVKELKNKYEEIFYAGDSAPDFKASLLADTVFAKSKLQDMLKEEGHPFIGFNNFSQVENYLTKIGVI